MFYIKNQVFLYLTPRQKSMLFSYFASFVKKNKNLKKMGSAWVSQLKGLTNIHARIVNNKYGSYLLEIINNEMKNYLKKE